MSSIMRRRRGLKSASSILLSEGDGLQHPHPLSQEAIYATLPLTPRQRRRSIPRAEKTTCSTALFPATASLACAFYGEAVVGVALRASGPYRSHALVWTPSRLHYALSPRHE